MGIEYSGDYPALILEFRLFLISHIRGAKNHSRLFDRNQDIVLNVVLEIAADSE